MNAKGDGAAAGLQAHVVLAADLGAFLFAEAWVEPSGTSVTVLSALARLGLDPWDEAGRLAKLPQLTAAADLTRSLAALPGKLRLDAVPAAARLVALLPRKEQHLRSPSAGNVPRAEQARHQAILVAVVALVACLAIILVGHLTPAAGGTVAASQPSGAVTDPATNVDAEACCKGLPAR